MAIASALGMYTFIKSVRDGCGVAIALSDEIGVLEPELRTRQWLSTPVFFIYRVCLEESTDIKEVNTQKIFVNGIIM